MLFGGLPSLNLSCQHSTEHSGNAPHKATGRPHIQFASQNCVQIGWRSLGWLRSTYVLSPPKSSPTNTTRPELGEMRAPPVPIAGIAGTRLCKQSQWRWSSHRQGSPHLAVRSWLITTSEYWSWGRPVNHCGSNQGSNILTGRLFRQYSMPKLRYIFAFFCCWKFIMMYMCGIT